MKYRLSSWITPGQRLADFAWVLLVWRKLTRSGGSYSTAPLSVVRNQPTVMGPEAGPSSGRSKVTLNSMACPFRLFGEGYAKGLASQ